jgi:hypothetical protein
MRFNLKDIGLVVVLLLLILGILGFIKSVSYLKSSIFPIPIFFNIELIMIIIAIISIFWNYKFNWIVISLPFFWWIIVNLLSLKYLIIAPLTFSLIVIYLGMILDILVICYLIIKGIKKIESLKYELSFAVPMIIILIIEFFNYLNASFLLF